MADVRNQVGARQDKGEGRMAPKCARLLSGARPSASADAIQPFGVRAVCGPWPEGAATCSASCSRRVSRDRKSTRLNSSHGYISYAVFCLKKKKKDHNKNKHIYHTTMYITHTHA